MSNKNNKGFLLTESLIVSTFVLTVLTFLFVQFRNLMSNHKKSYIYNNVETIYNLGSIADYLKNTNQTYTLKNELGTSDYIIIYKDQEQSDLCTDFCSELASQMNLKIMIYTNSNISNLKNSIDNNSQLDKKMKDFIKKVDATEVEGKGRIIAQFKDDSFSTVAVDMPVKFEDVELGSANKVLLVNKGDGLYKDLYNSDKTNNNEEYSYYVYKGKNPNNYINFDDKIWRIISIEIKEDSKVLKIIHNEPIETESFDSSRRSEYCESEYGCKVWGSSSTMLNQDKAPITEMPVKLGDNSTIKKLPEQEAALNIFLTNWYNNQIINTNLIRTSIFNVGLLKSEENKSLEENIASESQYGWQGQIGLINATDYVKTSSNQNCNNINAYSNNENCYSNSQDYNWLTSENKQITMSAGANESYHVWYINGQEKTYDKNPYQLIGNGKANENYAIRPVVYISGNFNLKNEGTINNPFEIETN